jgi:hypothetical protein
MRAQLRRMVLRWRRASVPAWLIEQTLAGQLAQAEEERHDARRKAEAEQRGGGR